MTKNYELAVDMAMDVAHHRAQRFTINGHLIHDGPRQNHHQMRNRLRTFLLAQANLYSSMAYALRLEARRV